MVDIKNIPAKLKSDCRFCVWKFEKRSGQKTKMPYNPANGDRARINDLRTFADFKTTLMTYAMAGTTASALRSATASVLLISTTVSERTVR